MFVIELLGVSPGSNAGNPRINSKDLDQGKQFLKMNGSEVFRHAVKRFPEVIYEGLKYNKLGPEDINLLIPHQANMRITKMVQKKLGLQDHQVFSNIHKYGNTTAATIPIALAEAVNQQKINDNDIIVFAAFGSGFTWASAIIKW